MGCHCAGTGTGRRTTYAADPALSEYARTLCAAGQPWPCTRPRGRRPLKVKQNGQIKVLSCLFYVATSRAGQQVHVIWNQSTVEIFTHDGEHLIAYPRPATTGMYYGPRSAPAGHTR